MRRVVKDKISPIFQPEDIPAAPLQEFKSQIILSEKRLIRHIKDANKLKRLVYFTASNLEALDIVAAGIVLLAEEGIEYHPGHFYKIMWKILGRENYARIRSTPYLYKHYLRYNNDWKAKARRNCEDWYIKHLLSKHYTAMEISNHPDLVEQKREEILNLRKNNNQPAENNIPALPGELIDLSLIDQEYKGYAITAYGELYSCKALFRTDVLFTNQWRPIKKRKNGCIRLNIKGVKKELSLKKVLNKLQLNTNG